MQHSLRTPNRMLTRGADTSTLTSLAGSIKPDRGNGGILNRLLTSLFVLLLAVSACGRSPEEQAVRTAYNDLTDNLEAGDYQATYDMMSSNTRTFLDDLAEAFQFYGMGMGDTGSELLTEMMSEVDMSDLSRDITSVTITGNRAQVVTATIDGDETTEFVLEDGAWRLDFEQFMKDAIDEGLAGSGMTVDDILAHEIEADTFGSDMQAGMDFEAGSGSCPVRITNGLGSYEIWFVYVSSADMTEWGNDWLGSSRILSPGNTITVNVAPGTYDIMVEDEDGDTYSNYGAEVGPSGYSWTPTLSDMD